MVDRVQNPKRCSAPDADCGDKSMAEARDVATVKKVKMLEGAADSSKLLQRAEKLLAAEKAKADLRLAKETKQNESDDCFTSQEMIDAFEASFGKIEIDPCWHKDSKVRPIKYLDVREGHNGLRDRWTGDVAFVNPPWSAQDAWVKCAYEKWLGGEVKIVVCLVPAAVNAPLFHSILRMNADVYFPNRRQRFFKSDGSSHSSMRHVMLVMFGTTHEQRMRFADLIDGSWWFQSRTPKVRWGNAKLSPLGMLMSAISGSCTAPNYVHTVSCAPVVDSMSRDGI